ncbi:MAG: YHYH protein [Saprospiraceae bacterium]|nr:YHYH protein [Saprospiraceae bacterium]
MTKIILIGSLLFGSILCKAQLNPAITSFLQNTTTTGTYYVKGNSIAQSNGILINCQRVAYSADNVYITTTGVPAYPTGPFLDGNPSNATNQNAIFKLPLNPVQNTGTPTATTGGNIGVFINGVALFDYRDGVAWNANTNALCGGPGNPPCPGGMGTTQNWNRDAIPAEKAGFDCSKAHPAMGNYHHHQNPSAFKLDINVISTICNLYDADGLYAIDSTQHSPLIGFAYDGFPIYGAYGYKNVDGTGGIVRIKSSYSLRTNMTVRNTNPAGTMVTNGAPINATYPLGYFREDYQYIATSAATPDYLDEHNGRFCITPEYPNGIYCYFATVDANWNSTYPYVVGPTFYGVYANRKVTSVTEATTVYNSITGIANNLKETFNVTIFPNPSNDFIAIQVMGLNKEKLIVELYDAKGTLIQKSSINAGATNTYLDTRTLYSGNYLVKISGVNVLSSKQLVIIK